MVKAAVAAAEAAAPIWFYSIAIEYYFCDLILDREREAVDIVEIVKCFSVVDETQTTEDTLIHHSLRTQFH